MNYAKVTEQEINDALSDLIFPDKEEVIVYADDHIQGI